MEWIQAKLLSREVTAEIFSREEIAKLFRRQEAGKILESVTSKFQYMYDASDLE